MEGVGYKYTTDMNSSWLGGWVSDKTFSTKRGIRVLNRGYNLFLLNPVVHPPQEVKLNGLLYIRYIVLYIHYCSTD